MNNMKQWQQDISNAVDKNSLDIKNLHDNAEVGKLTVRIDNIEAKLARTSLQDVIDTIRVKQAMKDAEKERRN